MSHEKIKEMIRIFTSNHDISIGMANQLEVAIDDEFPNDDFLQHTVEMLSRYRPGGGEFLFNEGDMKLRLIKTIKYIEELDS